MTELFSAQSNSVVFDFGMRSAHPLANTRTPARPYTTTRRPNYPTYPPKYPQIPTNYPEMTSDYPEIEPSTHATHAPYTDFPLASTFAFHDASEVHSSMTSLTSFVSPPIYYVTRKPTNHPNVITTTSSTTTTTMDYESRPPGARQELPDIQNQISPDLASQLGLPSLNGLIKLIDVSGPQNGGDRPPIILPDDQEDGEFPKPYVLEQPDDEFPVPKVLPNKRPKFPAPNQFPYSPDEFPRPKGLPNPKRKSKTLTYRKDKMKNRLPAESLSSFPRPDRLPEMKPSSRGNPFSCFCRF